MLFESVESAIIDHAKYDSVWWQCNRERLCFSSEAALRYFAILACTVNPIPNIKIIGRMLTDKSMLSYELHFEMGTLCHAAFIHLPPNIQVQVINCILTLRQDACEEEPIPSWILSIRAEFIAAIPCHLRSPDAQSLLSHHEAKEGKLIRVPRINSYCGFVQAPFSFEIFLKIHNDNVLRLLCHYAEYQRDFNDRLIGGKEEVGRNLNEAASRDPKRFINFLFVNWHDIPEIFREEIMEGVAHYILYKTNSFRPDKDWKPVAESNLLYLAEAIIDELERHPTHWHHHRAASRALYAISHVITDPNIGARITFLALGFINIEEESSVKGESINLITSGINMISGRVAEAMMILATRFKEADIAFPELLSPTLFRFAGLKYQAVRSLILRRLPNLQYFDTDLGWKLFHAVMQDKAVPWQYAESCLYYAYYNDFKRIKPLLARILQERSEKDLETWGRISALSALSNHIQSGDLLTDLRTQKSIEAWQGAVSVWSNNGNIKRFHEQCLEGIIVGLNEELCFASIAAKSLSNLFIADAPILMLPVKAIRLFFSTYQQLEGNARYGLFRFEKWLSAISQEEPLDALEMAEIYADYLKNIGSTAKSFSSDLSQLMTRLFAEAEEQEEVDEGDMIRRVVVLQDAMLAMGMIGMEKWLKAAERP